MYRKRSDGKFQRYVLRYPQPNLHNSLILFLFPFIAFLLLLGGCSQTDNQAQATATQTIILPSSTPTRGPVPSPTGFLLPPVRTPEVRKPYPAEGVVKFHILHWNDFHGELVEREADETWVPGAARLASFVKSETSGYDPNQVLILDAGDWFEGSPSSRQSRGARVLELYKQLGVDAITVGNHEFFLGVPLFYRMVINSAPIEIVSVNLRKTGPKSACIGERIVSPYKIFELGTTLGAKVRVAVLGISIEDLQYEAYSPIQGVCFVDPVTEVIDIYDELMQKEHPDVLIGVSHSGLEEDIRIAGELNKAGKPLDIIIGGHSHSWIDAPKIVGNTTIVTAGELGRAVGVFDLTYDRVKSLLDIQWQQEVFSHCSPEDPDTLASLQDIIPPGYTKKECMDTRNPAYDYLIDMTPAFESVGYWTLGKGVFPASDNGIAFNNVITSHGTEYLNGLFAHSPSELRFNLDGKYAQFVSVVSIKETACGDGAGFSVYLDNNEIYRVESMLPSDEPIPLSLDVSSGKVLTLKTISGDDASCDWTIWGDPYLVNK